MMKDIIMYTGPLCNFCDAAKRLFSRNNLKYKEIDISSKEGLRDEMIKKANGKRTIPQIFFNEDHIGGYQELRALEKENKLKDLLK
jgi:glutaredoxin 3